MLQYLQDGASQAIKRIQILQSEYLEVQRGQRVERWKHLRTPKPIVKTWLRMSIKNRQSYVKWWLQEST